MKLSTLAATLLGAALALVTIAPQAVAAPEEPGGGATPMIIGGGNASNAP